MSIYASSPDRPTQDLAENDSRFMALAVHIGTWSTDRSKGVGAIIAAPCGTIVSSGFNAFPRGVAVDQDERHARPEKYLWTEHAERNAIYSAARIGISLAGTHLYTQRFPCAACARAIAQSGISRIVCPTWIEDNNDSSDHRVAIAILEEAGVIVSVASLPNQ